ATTLLATTLLATTLLAVAAPSPAVAQPGPALDVLWRRPLVTHTGLPWKPRELAGALLSPDGSRLYTGSAGGVHAFAALTGTLLWDAPTAERVSARPALFGPTLYVATGAGDVYAFDAVTGGPIWPAPVPLEAQVVAPLAADADRLYVAADPGMLAALDRKTGKPIWRHAAEMQREFLVEGQGGALPLGGLVFVGLPGGQLIALSGRDGGLVWEVALERKERSPYADVDSTPVHVRRGGLVARSDGDWLLAASHSGGLCAVRAADGTVVWRAGEDGMGQPVVDGSEVFVVSAGPTLHVLDLATGRRLRSRRLGTGGGAGIAVIDRSWLALAGEQGVDLVGRRSLMPTVRAALEAGVAAAPVAFAGRLAVVSNAGVAYLLGVRTSGL
ncbi:MAG: hypothetical protein EXR79_16680, partial [Myxococcales bacterium]|nr:hypothetical protein [Myxococcales bacterium]